MKRLVSATLALSLLGGTAASAQSFDHGDRGYSNGYGDQYRGGSYRGRGGNDGGAVVAGIGILALAAILASQHRHHDRYRDGWYGRDGRNYGYDQRYGYGNSYNGSSNDSYRNQYYGNQGGYYGNGDRRW